MNPPDASELALFPLPSTGGGPELLLDELNEAQRAAVTHGPGPLLVLAGAGTGKTGVLTRRVAWLIATRRARPSEILGLTFTDKAAQEMEDRVDRLVPFGYADATLVTFHAFGQRLLSEFGLLLGLAAPPRVVTEAETVVFLRARLFELPIARYRPAGDPTQYLSALVRHMGRLRDEDIAPADYAAFAERAVVTAGSDAAARETGLAHRELAACYESYLGLLERAGLVDFAGLIALSLRLLREHPAVLEELRRRHPWILVDEFQDTNFAQFELVQLLAGERPNLTVVGDDDQSIYKFRGAAISNLLGFFEAYPGATRVVLTENYRSTQGILDAAYRLIRHNDPDRLEVKGGVDKRLVARGEKPAGPPVEHFHFDTASTEADTVADRIARDVAAGTRAFGDFAVLVRRHASADPIRLALNLHGVPHRYSGGGGLFDRPEVAAALDALRTIADPTDGRAFYFLAASEIYGTPVLDLATLAGEARRRNRPLETVVRAALRASSGADGSELSAEGREALARLVADLEELRPFALAHATGETLYRFLSHTGYLARLSGADTAEADERVQNLARLFDRTRGFADLGERDRVAEFVQHVDLLADAGDDPSAAEAGIDDDAVHVLTIHKAKGLEFPVVYLVGLEAQHFPTARRSDPLPFPLELIRQVLPAGDFHLQEERRLFYVGMTRAREELVLTSARDHGGRRMWKPSPFVLEALDRPAAGDLAGRASALESLHRNASTPRPLALPLEPLADDEVLPLSHNQIDDYLACPLKYKYAHVLKVPLLPHHTVGYGLAIHNALREYYRHVLNRWPIELDDVIRAFEKSWTGEGFITREHEESRLAQGRQALSRFWEREKLAPSRPLAVEKEFRFRIGMNQLRGRFDRIDVREGEGPVIVDFKSSDVTDREKASERAARSLQLKLYALAYRALFETDPAAVELHFVESGVVGRAAVTPETFAKAEAAIEEAAAGIRARAFAATPAFTTCGYCPYNAICPSRARGSY